MQVSLDKELSRYTIRAYDEGGITLILPGHLVKEPGQRLLRMEQSLLLTSELHQPWEPSVFGEIQAEHMEQCLEHGPEVVLLGCGASTRFLPAEVLAPLHRQGVGVEMMSTAAACRTFNILASEGRDVVAVMLLPGAD